VDQIMTKWDVEDKTRQHETATVEAVDVLRAKIAACQEWKEPWTSYGRNCKVTLQKMAAAPATRRVLSVRYVTK
jgi:hypothetical protein